jgi:hypothetical protein
MVACESCDFGRLRALWPWLFEDILGSEGVWDAWREEPYEFAFVGASGGVRVCVFVRFTAVLHGYPPAVMSCRGGREAQAEVRGARTRERVVHCCFSCISPASCRGTWIAVKRWLVEDGPRAMGRCR